MPKIIGCTIGPYPKDIFGPIPKVTAVFDDGEVKELFSFYPDELSFTEQEFIGLTEREARELRTRKDIAFLRG